VGVFGELDEFFFSTENGFEEFDGFSSGSSVVLFTSRRNRLSWWRYASWAVLAAAVGLS